MFRLPVLDQFGEAFLAGVTGLSKAVAHNKMFCHRAGCIPDSSYKFWRHGIFSRILSICRKAIAIFVVGFVSPPPGYNLSTTTAIADRLETAVKPHWSSVSGPEPEPGGPPKISNFFFVARNSSTFVGATSEQSQRASELIPIISRPVFP